jgi:hypothetical protein
MKAEEYVLGAYGEAYSAYHDAKQAMNIKEEELSDIEVEEGPVPITFPEIKAKPEVSCMSACPLLSRYHIFRHTSCVSYFHLSPYAENRLHTDQWKCI